MRYLREFVDRDLEELAEKLSKKAISRDTSEFVILKNEEQFAMKNIVYGALLAARWNHTSKEAVQGILDFAEYMFNNEFPFYEGYRSIYLPLDLLFNTNEMEIKVDEDKLRRYIDEG